MTATEAAQLVDGIADSLRVNNSQFNIAVNLLGQQVVSHGGTGLSVTAAGGGPGSTTVGQVVSAGGANVGIAPGVADDAMQQQIQALVGTLGRFSTELRATTPNRDTLQRIIDSLRDTWVPSMITSLLANLVTMGVGG